jgi:hypothetical protein
MRASASCPARPPLRPSPAATATAASLPGGRHLAGRVTDGRPSPPPHPSPLGELLLGGQRQLADPVQRIALAADGPVLDPSDRGRSALSRWLSPLYKRDGPNRLEGSDGHARSRFCAA